MCVCPRVGRQTLCAVKRKYENGLFARPLAIIIPKCCLRTRVFFRSRQCGRLSSLFLRGAQAQGHHFEYIKVIPGAENAARISGLFPRNRCANPLVGLSLMFGFAYKWCVFMRRGEWNCFQLSSCARPLACHVGGRVWIFWSDTNLSRFLLRIADEI